jgi:hypothetical protein
MRSVLIIGLNLIIQNVKVAVGVKPFNDRIRSTDYKKDHM